MQGIYWRLCFSRFAAIPGETAISPLELNATVNADSKLGALAPPYRQPDSGEDRVGIR